MDTANNTSAPATTAGGTPAPAPATPAVTTQQPPAAPATPALAFQQMSPEQFKARLAEERAAGAKETLSTLGVDTVDAAKTSIAKAKELELAKMTEAEKAAAKIAELEPAAKKAAALEATIKSYLEAEEKAVPEDKRGLLALAPTESHARLEWIAKAKAQGLFAAAPTAQQPLANTRAGGAAPPAGPNTPQKLPKDMTDAEFAAWDAERKRNLPR